jgi:hypothetical protein
MTPGRDAFGLARPGQPPQPGDALARLGLPPSLAKRSAPGDAARSSGTLERGNGAGCIPSASVQERGQARR